MWHGCCYTHKLVLNNHKMNLFNLFFGCVSLSFCSSISHLSPMCWSLSAGFDCLDWLIDGKWCAEKQRNPSLKFLSLLLIPVVLRTFPLFSKLCKDFIDQTLKVSIFLFNRSDNGSYIDFLCHFLFLTCSQHSTHFFSFLPTLIPSDLFRFESSFDHCW